MLTLGHSGPLLRFCRAAVVPGWLWPVFRPSPRWRRPLMRCCPPSGPWHRGSGPAATMALIPGLAPSGRMRVRAQRPLLVSPSTRREGSGHVRSHRPSPAGHRRLASRQRAAFVGSSKQTGPLPGFWSQAARIQIPAP